MRRVLIVVFVVAIAGCSSGKTPNGAPTVRTSPVEAHTEAGLKATAQIEFESFSAGNYGAVWGRLDAASKQLISRTDYIAAVSACPNPFDGAPIEIVKVTPNPDGTWSVELRAGGQLVTLPAAYENGRWVFPFTAQARARFNAHDTSC